MARPARSRPTRPSRPSAPRGAGPARAGFSAGGWALLLAASLGAALLLYRPALSGSFLSDDHHYVIDNASCASCPLENVVRILDPTGDAALSVSNYAPVQLLLHSAALRIFGDDTTGHHVMNVGLHALASVLLVALFLDTGLPWVAALLGGALFLVASRERGGRRLDFAAQVERFARAGSRRAARLRAPAGARDRLLHARAARQGPRGDRPAGRGRCSSGCARAACAGAGSRCGRRSSRRTPSSRPRVTSAIRAAPPRESTTPAVWLRTVVAIAMRYLVMAATSWGVSAFHETEPARRLLDPWFLAGLVALAGLGWRLAVALKRRSEEAVFWIWALFAFAPISQIFPFLYPMADRYLYFMLPGLIGAALFAARDAAERLPARRRQAAGVDRARAGRGPVRVLRRAQRRAGGGLALVGESDGRRRRALSGGGLGEPPARAARRAGRRRRGRGRRAAGGGRSAATRSSSRSMPIPPSPEFASIRSSAPSCPRSLRAGSSEGASERTRRNRSCR